MNVGLPGTGIGGLFYLLSAFAMLLGEILFTIQGKSSIKRWRLVLTQFGIATGVLIALAISGEILHLSLLKLAHSSSIGGIKVGNATVFSYNMLLISLLTLLFVIVFVQLLTLLVDTKE